ncbi:autotransporter-associated beta strand repeat-containing protein [uncultured Akkermansia sp.]|uniref:beta strand repeat-containing protein n=1 Tax=uncultured Akkermansia sp. TaxID=512294 RepID=UPI00265CB05B|nr:autotransporter-associated beta strand repeat-containing protein [uncultured Akkermansia sp.]
MAAAFFGTFASQSQAAGESISINFGTNESNGTITDSSSAGFEPVIGSNWNQFSGASQSTAQDLKNNNGDATGATVTWSSKNTWRGGGTPSTGDSQMLKGYLDDGNGITINVSGLDFLTYGVYVYCNTDTANGNFSAKTINGVSYTWNGTSTVAGSSAWGATGTYGEAVEGTNTLYVGGQTSNNLTISAPSNTSGSGTRGCIAGIQIVNTYDGVKISATLDGTASSEWTASQLGDAAWTDANDGAGTYASVNVTNGPGALTIADGETRRTDAILVSGGDLSISGGSLNLSGPGILRAAEGTTLTVSSNISGTATLDGAGAVIMNGTNTLTGLSGSGALTLGDTASITITGDTASTYIGALTLGDNASITATNPNWTFGGALTMAAANYNANDSWAHKATSLTLTGAGDVEYTFEEGTLIPITHADSSLTVHKVTNGTGTINANHASDIAHLIIDAGTVNLAAGDTTYTFESITIGQNAKLSLKSSGTVLGGTPDMLMKAGSTFEMLNCKAYGADTPLNANITIDAAGAGVTIAGSYYGNATNLGGTITGEGELLITNGSSGTNSFTISSVISDKDASRQLGVKVNKNSSTVVFSGNNTYTGGTTIVEGTLQAGSATAFGQGAVLVQGGTLNASSQALANAITLQAGTIQELGSVSAPKEITVSLTGNATIHDSTVVLSNAAGTPLASTGQVLTLSGTTSATLNNVTLNLSSFNTALIDMQETSTLNLTGGLTLNLGSDLELDPTSLTIALITQGENTSLADNIDWDALLTLTQNNQNLIWDGVTYDNGSLTFTGLTVPEPGTATLSLLGLTALLMRRRKKA